MKSINEAKSILKLERTVIDRLSFERYSDDVDKIDDEASVTFSHKMDEIGELMYRVSVGVTLTAKDRYDIKAQISGIFSANEDSILGKKVLVNNTVAILFPYLRSQLTLLTSQPGFEPVILPVMNINALMSEEH